MKKSRIVASLLCLTLSMPLGCGSAQSPSQEESTAALTGEELMKGILLGQGPVAERLPEAWESDEFHDALEASAKAHTTTDLAAQLDRASEEFLARGLTPDEVAGMRASAAHLRSLTDTTVTPVLLASTTEPVLDGLISLMKRKDPEFLASFKTEIESGDPVRVEAMLSRGADELRQLTGVSTDSVKPGSVNPDCVYAIAIAAAWWVAVGAAVVVANTAAIANVAWVFNVLHMPKQQDPAGPSIHSLSGTIANRFAR